MGFDGGAELSPPTAISQNCPKTNALEALTPDGRSRYGVARHGFGGLAIDVDVDTGIVGFPCTGDRCEISRRRIGSARASDD